MSEDENHDVEEFEEPKQKVEITIKKDEKSKSLEQQLQEKSDEAEDYKSKLELIAEKEFERKKREVGAPDDIQTPEELKGFITAKQPKREPAGTIPLTPEQLGDVSDKVNSPDSVHSMTFDSYLEMLGVLEQRSKMGDSEADEVLKALAKQSTRRSSTYEFQGSIKKHLQVVEPTEKQAEERAENNRNWKRKR